MILSVSRRTDIPNYYSDWFFNRLREGFLYVRNPMNPHQISRISLSAQVVDCIVFWTKNPEPMLERLEELKEYPFYFQFTLTGYGKDIEPGVPHKKDEMIRVFQQLSERIGSRRVIWRYDPILFNQVYTPEYHRKAFSQIASALKGCTEKCVISFVDTYAKNRKSMENLKVYDLEKEQLLAFAGSLAEEADRNHMAIASCAEAIDLSACGICPGSCIDKALIEELTGCSIRAGKDKNQRTQCGCVESVEVGTYDTCLNGCVYCYANQSRESVRRARALYDPDSPLLCGRVGEKDRITERKMESLKETQMSFL